MKATPGEQLPPPVVGTPTPVAAGASPISPAQLTVLVVCVVSVYFLIGFYGKSAESYRISQRAEQVNREIARLEAENKAYEVRLAYYMSEGYVETAARDKLNLVRAGDRSLVVIGAEPEVAWVDGPPIGETAKPMPELGHVADWLALFFAPR